MIGIYGMLDDREPVTLMVNSCARCGKDHLVSFYQFKEKPIRDNQYWGICPKTNDPVLMKIEIKDPDEDV